jgi:hypothetical protein
MYCSSTDTQRDILPFTLSAGKSRLRLVTMLPQHYPTSFFQLFGYLVQPQPLSLRNEKLQRLLGDAHLTVRRFNCYRAHVVHAVG